MVAKLLSGSILGLSGVPIEVEVDVAHRGFPVFTIVGLPNKAVDEAKERVRTALINSHFQMPDSRITVNLAPANFPKIGSGFDLPIALGVLAAAGTIDQRSLKDCLFIGELSLHGELRAVPGIISIAMMAKEKGLQKIFVPMENASEAAYIDDIEVYGIATLRELVNSIYMGQPVLPFNREKASSLPPAKYEFNFNEVKGQEQAKRALQIAAAGHHNIHLQGSPGAGKTMLCRAFPSILPKLDKQEIFEVSKIYSSIGLLSNTLKSERPFRSPHHTTSKIGLIGGGVVPTPGEISLAHRGVLFLDELPEFERSTLEALRQPMEDGRVLISRAIGSLEFPCRFLLLAASNPCPCGFLYHPKKKCSCMPGSISMYQKKLSGPVLDRIDLHVTVLPVEQDKLISKRRVSSSEEIKLSVENARELQKQRYKDLQIKLNSELRSSLVKNVCKINSDADSLLSSAISRMNLSARSYFKVIKIAQTIADLESQDRINTDHINEALQYRYNDS